MNFVKDGGVYRQSAFENWAREKVADPWIIATAAANSFTIVTTELPSGGLHNGPNGYAKIPDVANHFNVKWINVFEFMRQTGMQI